MPINKRVRALLYILMLFPLWWIQRIQAQPLTTVFVAAADGGGQNDEDDGGDGDDDDGDDDDGDDCSIDDDASDDGDDDDGDDDDVDCNDNGIKDRCDIANGTSLDVNDNGVPDECEPGVRSFCAGDGSANGGADCPCLNNAPAGTNSGCLNRSGVGASLTASGEPSVSNDTLVLTVTGIPDGVPAYFFQGGSDAGFQDFFNGLRCIGAPFVRMGKIAGSSGGVSFPFAGDPPISDQFDISAGETTYYQVLYRDNNGPCGFAANASNALQVVWGP